MPLFLVEVIQYIAFFAIAVGLTCCAVCWVQCKREAELQQP